MPSHLTARDQQVLRDIWRGRYLTSAHLARLHFSHPKLAQRRLRILTSAGFLTRFAPPDARRTGFQTWWYVLARKGARVVSEALGLPLKATLPPTRMPGSLGFLAHHALTTDVRIWLGEACAACEGFASYFLPSYDHMSPTGERARRAMLTLPDARMLFPDGAVLLSKGERAVLFLLEVDRGTEPLSGTHPSAIARKLLAYREAYDTRAEAALATRFPLPFEGFRVLCVVPDHTRQAHVTHLAQRLDLAPLVWTTTHARMHEPGRLDAPIWAVTRPDDLHALSE